jgi:hypothetical protein
MIVSNQLDENILTDSNYPVKTKSITLAEGQGVLKRGSVLYAAPVMTTGDDPVPTGDLTYSLMTEGETPNCILCGETDTTETENVLADAYESGSFCSEKLVCSTDYTLTEIDRDTLRSLGIITQNIVIA